METFGGRVAILSRLIREVFTEVTGRNEPNGYLGKEHFM